MTDSTAKCPVMHGQHADHTATGTTATQHWWPNQLSLKMLHQNTPAADPMGDSFDYAKEFKSLNLKAVKKEIGRAHV